MNLTALFAENAAQNEQATGGSMLTMLLPLALLALVFYFVYQFFILYFFHSVQFSSVAQSCPTLCDPMNLSTPGLPVHHQLLEFTQTHVHQVSDAIQPSHPLLSPSPPAPSPSQHESFPMSQLFARGGQSTEVSMVLQSFLKQEYRNKSKIR